jgi:hypothetical protein
MTKFEALAEKFDKLSEQYGGTSFAQLCAELCRLLPTLAERDQVTGAPEPRVFVGVDPAAPNGDEAATVTMRCDFEVLGISNSGQTPIVLPRRPVLYCYAPQQRAVAVLLNGAFALRTVHHRYLLQGLSGGTFAVVTGHRDRVPPDMCQMLQLHGWVVVTIDDSYARARAGERQS